MLLELLIAIIIAVVTWLLFLPPQPPLLGIYSQPGRKINLIKFFSKIQMVSKLRGEFNESLTFQVINLICFL